MSMLSGAARPRRVGSGRGVRAPPPTPSIRIPALIAAAPPDRVARVPRAAGTPRPPGPPRLSEVLVLRRVDRDVDPPREERLLELLHEDAAAADLAEQPRTIPVAGCRDGDGGDLDPGPSQRRRGAFGLGEREPAAARADPSSTATRVDSALAGAPQLRRRRGECARTRSGRRAGADERAEGPPRRVRLVLPPPDRTDGARRQHRTSPSGATAASFIRTVGRWRSFATICAVTVSTTARSPSDRRPRRLTRRGRARPRGSPRRARSDAITGTTVSALPRATPPRSGDSLGMDGLPRRPISELETTASRSSTS